MNTICIAGFGKLGIEIGSILPSGCVIRVVDLKNAELSGVEFFSPENIEEALTGAEVLLISHNNPNDVAVQAQAAAKKRIPVIVATTGLSRANIAFLKSISDRIPIIISDNFSLGVALLARQVREAARTLPAGWTAEIVECHHGEKLDCPSGTAMKLAKEICLGRNLDPELAIKVGRPKGRSDGPRKKHEIYIHSVRGGTVFGKHTVTFFGTNECCNYEHEAGSRRVFANGAVYAINWIINRTVSGLYDMNNVYGLS